MNKYLILFFFTGFLSSCNSVQDQEEIFDASRPEGISYILNNLESVNKPGEYLVTGPMASVVFLPDKGYWNLNAFVFIDCEIENLSGKVQLAELMINGDRWTMGGIYIEPSAVKTLRSIIMRQNPSHREMAQFPNMNGYPGGSLHLWWKSYVPDSIKSIAINFPLSENGDKISIGKAFARELLKTYSDTEYKALLPIIDEYGQYIHKEWPGKIHNEKELQAADEAELNDLKANPGYTEMGKYGGWKNGPQLQATGHFRVDKYNGVWAIIDPEGFLFWSHGIDCVRPASDTPVGGRERLFAYLPDKMGPFAEFIYKGRVSSTYTPDSTGRIDVNSVDFVNFYGMNLKRKWGADYNDKFIERTIQRLKSWEMNTIANWSDPNVYERREIPYTINANTARNRTLADPFDPDFQPSIERQLVTNNKSSLDDPWCLGIFIDNEIHWGNEISLGRSVLTTNRYPFARKVITEILRKKYNSIFSLNMKWGSNFKSWSELDDNSIFYEGASEDMILASDQVANEYFSRCRNAVKKVARNKLYLGCRFDFHFYPETDQNERDWIIKYGGKYADVVSFNRYNYSCNTMKPLEGMDFPIILGEFHLGALDRGLPHSGLRLTLDQKERAGVYYNFLLQAVRNPFIVGVGWFQYIDQPYTGRNDGENYQIGFITVGDYPNSEIVESARRIGRNMYKERYGDKN